MEVYSNGLSLGLSALDDGAGADAGAAAAFFGGATITSFGQLRAEIWSVPSPPGIRPPEATCGLLAASMAVRVCVGQFVCHLEDMWSWCHSVMVSTTKCSGEVH